MDSVLIARSQAKQHSDESNNVGMGKGIKKTWKKVSMDDDAQEGHEKMQACR